MSHCAAALFLSKCVESRCPQSTLKMLTGQWHAFRLLPERGDSDVRGQKAVSLIAGGIVGWRAQGSHR